MLSTVRAFTFQGAPCKAPGSLPCSFPWSPRGRTGLKVSSQASAQAQAPPSCAVLPGAPLEELSEGLHVCPGRGLAEGF